MYSLRFILIFIFLSSLSPCLKAQKNQFEVPPKQFAVRIFTIDEKKSFCSGSIVGCEDKYFLYTASHCLEFVNGGGKHINSYISKLKVGFDKSQPTVISIKDSPVVEEFGDLARVELASNHDLIQQAFHENKLLKCLPSNFQIDPNTDIWITGFPKGGNAWTKSTKQSECELDNNSGFSYLPPEVEGIMIHLGRKSMWGSKGGASGGPAMIFTGDNQYHVGVISSQNPNPDVDIPFRAGNMLYAAPPVKKSQWTRIKIFYE